MSAHNTQKYSNTVITFSEAVIASSEVRLVSVCKPSTAALNPWRKKVVPHRWQVCAGPDPA